VIVDAHNDVLLALRVGGGDPSLTLELRRGTERLLDRHWVPRLTAAGVGVQVCPLYGACERRPGWRERALAQEAELRAAFAADPARVCLVRSAADLDDPRLRLVLSMEGAEPLEGDPGAFDEWYERGVRSVQLTWNHPNAFAGGIDTPERGLTARGRALVARLTELGVMLDLAHASERTWQDVLAMDVPFSVTHAGCRAVCDHPRNLSDRQLEALATHGGVLGMMAIPFSVDPTAPTLQRWLDHFDHALAVMGDAHVGIGADLIHIERAAGAARDILLEDFAEPEDYPALVAALRARGHDGARLEAILSGNWLRILRRAFAA
jgi:membrane dipeptidase